jgi:hypothetical protein
VGRKVGSAGCNTTGALADPALEREGALQRLLVPSFPLPQRPEVHCSPQDAVERLAQTCCRLECTSARDGRARREATPRAIPPCISGTPHGAAASDAYARRVAGIERRSPATIPRIAGCGSTVLSASEYAKGAAPADSSWIRVHARRGGRRFERPAPLSRPRCSFNASRWPTAISDSGWPRKMSSISRSKVCEPTNRSRARRAISSA